MVLSATYEVLTMKLKIAARWLALPIAVLAASVALAGAPKPATPDQIVEMIKAAGNAEDYGNAATVYVLDEADVYVQTSGLATTESCQVEKILTDEGVKATSVLRLDYDPDTYRVTIKSVCIHRKNGDIEDVPLSRMVTQPTRQWLIFWGGQQYVLPIPRLQVGDALEVRVSKIGFNIAYLGEQPDSAGGAAELQPPMPGHWHETTLFQGHTPIIRKRYSVHMPKDMPVQYEVCNGTLKTSLWFDGDRHVYTFEADDVPAIDGEPHMVSLDDCATKVVMATVPDWQTKSRWFWQANKDQFKADAAVQAKVDELIKGLKTDKEKIAALNHWVADNIRYYGTSRGPREGFTLHRGIETYCDRGGVCKDKAGMLITMLRAAGIEAYPALTMAGSRVEDIPADQFNHTVTVVRNQDGTFDIYDPTWIPLSREMWSSREALQGLVYGTPEGQTLTLSPYYPPDYNLLSATAESRIDTEGKLATTINMHLKGYPGTYLRRNIERYSKPQQRGAIEAAVNIAPTAKLDDVSFTDPYDYSQDARIRLGVSAARFAGGSGDLWALHMPLMTHPLESWLIPDLAYPLKEDSRKYGMRMRATRLVQYDEKLTLPDGWTFAHVPETQTFDSPSASLKYSTEVEGNTLTYHFEFAVKKHLIPPEDYAQYKKAIEMMNDIAGDWVFCRRGATAENRGQQASRKDAANQAG